MKTAREALGERGPPDVRGAAIAGPAGRANRDIRLRPLNVKDAHNWREHSLGTASERAAAVQAQIAGEKAQRGHTFPELGGITVRDGWVYAQGHWNIGRPFGYRRERLGPLAGACAGIVAARQPTASIALGVYNATAPKAGKVFVAFADGTRREFSGRAWRVAKLREAVDLFNTMADAAGRAGRVIRLRHRLPLFVALDCSPSAEVARDALGELCQPDVRAAARELLEELAAAAQAATQ